MCILIVKIFVPAKGDEEDNKGLGLTIKDLFPFDDPNQPGADTEVRIDGGIFRREWLRSAMSTTAVRRYRMCTQ